MKPNTYNKQQEFDVLDWIEGKGHNKELPIGTLAKVCEYISYIKYSSDANGLYDNIKSFLKFFTSDVRAFKINNGGNYKKLNRKYWGLFYFLMERLYPPNKSKLKKEFMYLFIRQKTKINITQSEYHLKELVEKFVEEIRFYYKNAIKTERQSLFKIKDETWDIEFKSLRRLQNKYIIQEYSTLLSKDKTLLLEGYIREHFKDMQEFSEYINDPFNDEEFADATVFQQDFIDLWNELKDLAASSSGFPKCVSYPDYFCENEFETILNGFIHSFNLKLFYEKIEEDYINIIRYMQAIVDMNYIQGIYQENDSTETYYHEELMEIKKYVTEKYDKVLNDFAETYTKKSKEYYVCDDDDDMKNLFNAISKENVHHVIENNRQLCQGLSDKGINIEYRGLVSPIIDKMKYHIF